MKLAEKGYNKCVDLLIQTGHDVNIQDTDGCTAVIFVAREGYDECLQLLLIAGAHMNKQNTVWLDLFDASCYDGL